MFEHLVGTVKHNIPHRVRDFAHHLQSYIMANSPYRL